MQKHYIGCVDEEGSVPCDLDTGDKYIQEVVCELKEVLMTNQRIVVTMRMSNGANHIYELKQVQEGHSIVILLC